MNYSLLSGSPLFKGLNTNDITTILSNILHRTMKYPAGSVIAQSGELVNSFMIIIKGMAKGEMVDYAGKIIKIEDIYAPGALAPAFIFGDRNRYPVNVIAVTETELLVINKSDFLKLLTCNDKTLINFLDMISSRSQFLSEKIKFLNFKTIKGKLAQYILQIADKSKGEIRLDRTQNDLADFFGVARPSIARALGEMEENGLIKANGKKILIINKKRLSDLTVEL